MSIWRYANPVAFMRLSARVLPVLSGLTAVILVTGIGWGFFATPDDYRMGSSARIIYIHVPSAFIAINAWLMMLAASLIWLVRRHPVSALAAKAAAPIGATMTVIAILTGAFWGQQTWGTYWVWDPRLTSFMILLVFYLGYIALSQAVEDPEKNADLTAILCMVGSVFALLSRYAVLFWNQGLHQGASLSLDAEENIADVFWYPLVVSIGGFVLLFVTLLLIRTRTEIRLRRIGALMQRLG